MKVMMDVVLRKIGKCLDCVERKRHAFEERCIFYSN